MVTTPYLHARRLLLLAVIIIFTGCGGSNSTNDAFQPAPEQKPITLISAVTDASKKSDVAAKLINEGVLFHEDTYTSDMVARI